MATEDNKAVVRRSFDGNLDTIDEVFAKDFIDHNPLPGQQPGRAGFKEAQALMHSAWTDRHATIEDQIAEGDRVASRVTNTGRHVGEFMGIPATGKEATVTLVSIDRVVDGKIVETWTSMDMLDLLQQLGAASPTTTTTT